MYFARYSQMIPSAQITASASVKVRYARTSVGRTELAVMKNSEVYATSSGSRFSDWSISSV